MFLSSIPNVDAMGAPAETEKSNRTRLNSTGRTASNRNSRTRRSGNSQQPASHVNTAAGKAILVSQQDNGTDQSASGTLRCAFTVGRTDCGMDPVSDVWLMVSSCKLLSSKLDRKNRAKTCSEAT
jgi:hypothetical protein